MVQNRCLSGHLKHTPPPPYFHALRAYGKCLLLVDLCIPPGQDYLVVISKTQAVMLSKLGNRFDRVS